MSAAVQGTLIVVTGPPGAGKSSLSRALADASDHSVLVEGDEFFRFVAGGRIEPWMPGSGEQNTVVIRAAASAAGTFAAGGYTTVYDGVVGPWFLPVFAEATRLERLDYLMLLPPVERCVRQVAERVGHGFTDEPATRKMHAEFSAASIDGRHVMRDLPDTVEELVTLAVEAAAAGRLAYRVP